jgi:hypothetical protein
MVVDGMGGRIGQEIVSRLRTAFGTGVELLAVGTNSAATAAMMKAGANRGATGENAVRITVRDADVVIGPLSVLIPDSMMGEVTPLMAESLALSSARKVMLPLTNPRIDLVGITKNPLPHLMDEAIAIVASMLEKEV